MKCPICSNKMYSAGIHYDAYTNEKLGELFYCKICGKKRISYERN